MVVTKSHFKRYLNLTVSVKSNPDFRTIPATWLHIRKEGSFLRLFFVAKKQVFNDFDLLSTRNPIRTTRLKISYRCQTHKKLLNKEIVLTNLKTTLLIEQKY